MSEEVINIDELQINFSQLLRTYSALRTDAALETMLETAINKTKIESLLKTVAEQNDWLEKNSPSLQNPE